MKLPVALYNGDAPEVLRGLPDERFNCCVTSPPYWGLRNYNVEGQIGLEPTPEAYVAKMVEVFREVRRVLRKDGTCWVNLGDSYVAGGRGGGGSFADERPGWDGVPMEFGKKRGIHGLKPKDLVGIPWRVAFALQADGWYLRQDIIWAKPNPMPESVRDRCTKAHEYLFLLTKSAKYWWDQEAIKEPSVRAGCANLGDRRVGDGYVSGGWLNGGNVPDHRNRRSVWTIPTAPFSEAHFATFPPKLVEPCILAGCPADGVVLDPFLGSGTTALVALSLGRRAVGIELSPEYFAMAKRRIEEKLAQPDMFHEAERKPHE